MRTIIPISAVIITKNEAKNILRCLDSVIKVSTEIVLIDSYSSDITFEEVNKFKMLHPETDFNVIQSDWIGYAGTKNQGNKLAKHPWILSIDADEVLDKELIESILKKFNNPIGPGTNDWFSFNRLTNYCGRWIKHCGWYPEYKTRIFNKENVKWIGDFVHETLEHSGIKSTPIKLSGHLLHYSFPSIAHHLKKVETFSSLGADELYSKGKKGSKWRMIFSPIFKFISIYFIKLGFLDGIQGYWIARISAFDKFLRESKLISKSIKSNP